jgi:tight adherence protein C
VTPAVFGGGLGGVAAAGVIIAARFSPPFRRIRLHDRVAPYLREFHQPSRLLGPTPAAGAVAVVGHVFGPVLRDAARRVDGWVGGTASVRRRLDAAGGRMTVEEFRVEQVVWGAGGLGIGLSLAAVAATTAAPATTPVGFLIIAVVLAVGGVMLRDRALSHHVARREARLVAEFPTIAELLALAVGAGESPMGALDRVARSSGGELAGELARALAEARSGASLVAALEAMAARTSIPALARFVDGMAVAVERGTPLADVLRAQAIDVREEGRRALLEAGGRKEIAMLVPVVFFVLPVTVVFALFPGFYSVRLAVP